MSINRGLDKDAVHIHTALYIYTVVEIYNYSAIKRMK